MQKRAGNGRPAGAHQEPAGGLWVAPARPRAGCGECDGARSDRLINHIHSHLVAVHENNQHEGEKTGGR